MATDVKASVAPLSTVVGPRPVPFTRFTVSLPALTSVPPVCSLARLCMTSSPAPLFTRRPPVLRVRESNTTRWPSVSTVKMELFCSSMPQSPSLFLPIGWWIVVSAFAVSVVSLIRLKL